MLAYVLYSTYVRLWERRRPSGRTAIVVAVAALLPDLIDKPLAWQLELLLTGRSFGHSLLFAVPLVVIVLLAARRFDVGDVGRAFAIGYLSHLPADAVYPLVIPGAVVDLGYLIWPFASAGSTETSDLLGQVLRLLGDFSLFVSGPDGWRFLLLEAGLVALALGLWIADGRPGLGLLERRLWRRDRT